MQQPAVVVTGASTGIGWGVCKAFLAKGFRVFGSVRREADAERLRQKFGQHFTPLLFDVTDASDVHAGAAETARALGARTLYALINNAGVAVAGPLLNMAPDAFRQQLDVNLTGVVIATQAFAPLLGADRARTGPPGRIANISSVGAKIAFPFMAPYHASKFGLEGLSESLRRELLPFGIDVIIIAPGSVRTAIWDKAEQIDLSLYKDTEYAGPLDRMRAFMIANGRRGMAPEHIGRAICRILMKKRPRVRYTIAPDPLNTWITRSLPKRQLDRMVGERLGLSPARK